MRTTALIVEHRYKNKLVSQHRIDPSVQRELVLGSSRETDIRLLGQEVSGIHAILEYHGNDWMVSDLGSESGTWLSKTAIITEKISQTTEIRIGSHLLKVSPKEIDTSLFLKAKQVTEAPKVQEGLRTEMFHQVVVKRKGVVIDTLLLKPTQSFTFFDGQSEAELAAPQSKEWSTHTLGAFEVRQRLAEGASLKPSFKDLTQAFFDPELRLPMGVAGAGIFLLILIALLIPKSPTNQLNPLAPDATVYSRVIFDSNLAKKAKAQAKADAVKKSSQTNKAGGAAAPSKQAANAVPNQAITKIRASGLSQLIGKISKRANINSKYLVQAQGVSPDSSNSGRALASLSTAGSPKLGGAGGGAEGTFKLSGVGTAGKGGGSGAYKSGTGLSEGQIGNANVGIVDEETEVVGGLDKEEIAKTIKSQLGEIRYCYERQLSANPDLYGKVLVKFTIGGEGKVLEQKIGSSTLSNAMVEGCILRRVASWKFPRPQGGTSVIVSYPFLLKSAN